MKRALDRAPSGKAARPVPRPARKRRGAVSASGTLVGHIEETPSGSRFVYWPDYLATPSARPISPTLPLREEPYETARLHPFFQNLLPEGWLLDITCRTLGIDRDDELGLLLGTCRDCAGNVEITPVRESD